MNDNDLMTSTECIVNHKSVDLAAGLDNALSETVEDEATVTASTAEYVKDGMRANVVVRPITKLEAETQQRFDLKALDSLEEDKLLNTESYIEVSNGEVKVLGTKLALSGQLIDALVYQGLSYVLKAKLRQNLKPNPNDDCGGKGARTRKDVLCACLNVMLDGYLTFKQQTSYITELHAKYRSNGKYYRQSLSKYLESNKARSIKEVDDVVVKMLRVINGINSNGKFVKFSEAMRANNGDAIGSELFMDWERGVVMGDGEGEMGEMEMDKGLKELLKS